MPWAGPATATMPAPLTGGRSRVTVSATLAANEALATRRLGGQQVLPLGFGEAGNFPAAIKSVAEWYPKQDRAFATSIFNSGSNVAAMFGPAIAGVLALTWGWRGAFYLNGALGLVWVVLWLILYRNPPVKPEDEGVITAKIGWLGALKYPEAWGFALGKFLTDGVWWFYLFWLPPYLYDVRHFNLKEVGWAMPVLYSAASVGSLIGGAIPSYLGRRGWDMRKARPTAMALCALCMPIAATAVWVKNPILMVLLICFGLGGHQGWSANIFSLAVSCSSRSVTYASNDAL